MAWTRLMQRWKQYKYRFVPWIALNLKNRSVRSVPKGSSDKLVSDTEINQVLLALFSEFYGGQNEEIKISEKTETYQNYDCQPENDPKKTGHIVNGQNDCSKIINSDKKLNYSPNDEETIQISQREDHRMLSQSPQQSDISHKSGDKTGDVGALSKDHFNEEMLSRGQRQQYGDELVFKRNLRRMKDMLGFTIERRQSLLETGGQGVIVTEGKIPPSTLLALYPGAVYFPFEPVLFQSLGNPFIFRCIDRLLIDGNDKNLSKFVYRSCSQRDRVGPYFSCDMSWLKKYPANPLAVGQYINNHNKEHGANVAYQEFDVPESFPFELRQFIPNVYYSPNPGFSRPMRMVVLISTREISAGEELFSSYFTVVH